MAVITRFAPSPTGTLHLGSARTALFNWLYARHYGGQFLLRIEDTDRERSTLDSQNDIEENLKWLGLCWDGEKVIQSQRQQRHKDVAYALLEAGKAYRCYCTPQELAQLREQALAEGRPPLYDRRWRNKEDHPMDQPFAIRLKTPLEGVTFLNDQVQGPIKVDNHSLDDMVLLRSDGTPTYMLAVVVDDHDMGVTHIIRGDDHLTNAFRQLQIYHAMGWNAPSMAHIPLIHSMDGAKLSKRHGATSVSTYRDQGILPEALFNGLLRLGWSHGNEEKISRAQAVSWFDGTSLSKSAARFDYDKILALNSHYLKQMTAPDLWALLEQTPPLTDLGERERGMKILPALAQRSKTLQEIKDSLPIYTFPHLDPLPSVSREGKEILVSFAQALPQELEWSHEALEKFMRNWAQDRGMGFGQLAKLLRIGLTGQPVSPGLTDIMGALGREWVIDRLYEVQEEGQEAMQGQGQETS